MSHPASSFDQVYSVTIHNAVVDDAAVDLFARDCYQHLPTGHREYVTRFGAGELCDLLRVRTPEQIRRQLAADDRERQDIADGLGEYEFWQAGVLTTDDAKESFTFATSAEGDSYICCPRFKGTLFELPRHSSEIRRFDDGLYGVVTDCSDRMKCEFPFFQATSPRRKVRRFAVRADVGEDGFHAAIEARWKNDEVRLLRGPASDDNPDIFEHPRHFVRAIQGSFDCYLDALSRERLAEGSFTVVLKYDIDSEFDVAEFVESIRDHDEESWVKD